MKGFRPHLAMRGNIGAPALQSNDYFGTLEAAVHALLGEEAVKTMRERLGGRQIYVAKDPRAGSELVELFGLEAAQALGRHFGGAQVMIRTAGPIRNMEAVHRLTVDGWSAGRIANHLGISERHAYSLREALLREGRLK